MIGIYQAVTINNKPQKSTVVNGKATKEIQRSYKKGPIVGLFFCPAAQFYRLDAERMGGLEHKEM
jgi:hypothetical protein